MGPAATRIEHKNTLIGVLTAAAWVRLAAWADPSITPKFRSAADAGTQRFCPRQRDRRIQVTVNDECGSRDRGKTG